MVRIFRRGIMNFEVLHIRSGLRAGRIVCYDDSYGYFMEIMTPCSTPGPYPPMPPTPSPGVQWLSCNSCTGTSTGTGRMQNATCDLCTLL